jgi:hypothetical protein
MALEDATNPMQGVSGPGKFAKRTDLDYQSTSYGDGVAYDAAKSGAPLERAPKNPMISQAPEVPIAPAAPITSLYADTTRPDESIMSGVDRGDGPGSEALMMRRGTEKLSDILVKMIPYDTDGSINILYQEAIARGN